MIVRTYIDGFNLYYGCLKDVPGRKWLDLWALSERLAPKDTVDAVLFFTAKIRPPSWDPQKATRQQMYLRLLAADGRVTVIEGNYVYRTKPARLAKAPHNRVQIQHVEEKGSDVNLAAHLLMDGFNGRYQKAIVISNDSDLTEPVRMVKDELGLEIVLVNPHPKKKRSGRLSQAASMTRQIRHAVIEQCQFPDRVTFGTRTIQKPKHW